MMSAKLTTEEFIKRSIIKYDGKYTYEKSVYVNCKEKIIITCPKHGDFSRLAYSHLAGLGACSNCKKEKPKKERIDSKTLIERLDKIHNSKYTYRVMGTKHKNDIIVICPKHGDFKMKVTDHLAGTGCKKCFIDRRVYTTAEFIEKANAVHNYIYGYDKSIYCRSNQEIIIICQIHGEFLQTPAVHLRGSGCSKCGDVKTAQSLKDTINSFVAKASLIHNNKFNYEKVNYVNTWEKVTIICPIHGDFLQSPNNHLAGYGCLSCGGCKQLTTEDFINVCSEVHHNKYDYSKSYYKNSDAKIEIICSLHGSFLQAAREHMAGKGCRICGLNTSNIEIEWLNYIGVPDNEEYRSVTIRLNNKWFIVDGFNPKTNTVYEFNGDFWHGNPKIYSSEEINIKTKTTFGELYQKTLDKEKLLKEAGYEVISIWESDWKKLQKDNQ